MAYCPRCGALTERSAAFCTACGGGLTAAPGVTYETARTLDAPARATYHAPPPDLGRPVEQSTAIVALVLNILVWPGLGSIVAGETIGWAQGFLHLLGFVLVLTLVGAIVGIPLMIAMWIWGVVTGVQVLNRANAQQRARGAW